MRASETGETGSVGQDTVGVQFKKSHWGVAPNPTDQDLGTDLWLMARDLRRFDLCALVGAQVKSGVSACSLDVRQLSHREHPELVHHC